MPLHHITTPRTPRQLPRLRGVRAIPVGMHNGKQSSHPGIRRHRSGRPFARMKAEALAMWGDHCLHCGHPGATEVDHLTPLSVAPDQPLDPYLVRPSHGSNCPCPTCGQHCNQVRGVKPIVAALRTSIDW